MSATATQVSFADMIGELDWEDRPVPIDRLPAPIGPEPDGAFRRSVKAIGIMNPILLVDRGKGGYYVIDGYRRIRAAIDADLGEIPARVIPEGEFELGILTLIANEQRSENPIVEYWAVRALLAAGHSETEIAKLTSMSVPTIRKRMRLANLIPDFVAIFELGELSSSMADTIARLSAEDQSKLWDIWNTNSGRVTRDDVRAVREASRPVIAQTELPALPLTVEESASDALYEVRRLQEDIASGALDLVDVSQRLEAIEAALLGGA